MKKILTLCTCSLVLYTLTLVLCTSLHSCTIEQSDNGKLDGFWKLTRVDTLATGGQLNLSEKGIFWSVQMNLLSVEDKYDDGAIPILFRFAHEGGQLKLSEPRESYQMTGDKLVEDVNKLKPFGINQINETFQVETLNSSHLYLSTDKLRLSFTRF